MDDDELLAQLERLDPTRSDAPPAAGSDRHTSIQGHAMNFTLEAGPGPGATGSPARWPGRRWKLIGVAAAGVVAISAAAILVQRGDEPSAEAAIAEAADGMAAVTSLRAKMRFEDESETSDVTVAASDDKWQIVQEMRDRSAAATDTFRWIVVDGTEYYTTFYNDREETTAEPLNPNYELAPFGESSAAVIDAALRGSNIVDLGDEEVRGVQTTHYRLHLADPAQSALADLPRAQLGWFDLFFGEEYHHSDVTIDVWVANDLIRRMGVASPDGTFTADYFDFDTDITITPPAGPYVETPDGS